MALLDIVLYKKNLVENSKAHVATFKDQLTPSNKSLVEAFRQKKPGFILEIKPASPSEGTIRDNADIVQIAHAYAPFATVISVLADEKFFGGSYDNVAKVSALNACPVLCKDVVVSPWQIYEARYFGADAVLLMLSVLDDEIYRTCQKIAHDLGMDIITEVHTAEEMRRAISLGSSIIGINNRDLKTLKVNLATSEELVKIAPKNVLLIAESGFKNRSEIKRLTPIVDGFLIGTSLMRAKRVDLALRELIFGRIKICGLTNADDARQAYDLGAYYGGLNFSALSKRKVSLDEARLIKKDVPLMWGGVFVNQSIDEIVAIAQALKLDFVQLHGDERPPFVDDLRLQLPAVCEIWQALRIKDQLIIPQNNKVDRFLLDSLHASEYGGTGQSFNWDLIKNCPDRQKLVVAGGITPQNVKVVSELEPFAIDIASGVEENQVPRKKSFAKLKELFLQLWP